jgi:hypothetical protein
MKITSGLRVSGLVLLFLVIEAGSTAAQLYTVSGTVTGPGATPVSGVEIFLYDDLDNPIGIPPTVTNTSGFYSIAGLPAGTYGLEFDPPFVTKLLPVFRREIVVAGNVTVNQVLELAHVLSGFVRDSGGAAIPGIDLNVYDQASGDQIYAPGDDTDAFGFYDVLVPNGTFRLLWRSVSGDEWVPVEMQNVVVAADLTIDVTMVLGFSVSGDVKNINGQPVVGADLDVFHSATGVQQVTPNDNTDSAGKYLILLPQGTFDIQLRPPAASRVLPVELVSIPIANDTTINFFNLPLGLSLSGTVTNLSATGVAGVDLDVKHASTGVELLTPFDDTDSSGDYEVIVPTGVFDIEYKPPVATRLAPVARSAVSITADTVIDVTVPAGVLLAGEVRNPGGLGVAGVNIDAKDPVTGGDVLLVGDATGANGTFTVVLVPDTYHVEIEPPKALRLVAQRLADLIVTQDASIVVSLQSGFLVSGTVRDSVGALFPDVDVDAVVLQTSVEIFTPGDHTDAAGHYLIVVPPSTYSLRYKPISGVVDSVWLERVVAGDLVVNAFFGVATVVPGDGTDSPPSAALLQNHPNPFNPSTTIRYSIPEKARVRLRIYDAGGRLLRVLVDDVRDPGILHAAIWDGNDRFGLPVASGVYFYRLETNGWSESRKMVLLR